MAGAGSQPSGLVAGGTPVNNATEEWTGVGTQTITVS